MLTIIHGENIIASRNFLFSSIQNAKIKNKEIIIFNPQNLTPEGLITAFEGSLFSQQKLVVFESLSSLPSSLKKQIISCINQHQKDNNIIIFEKKTARSPWLRQFPDAVNRLFKPSPIIFHFLDGLGIKKNRKQNLQFLNQLFTQKATGLVFYFLTKRLEDLILVKEKKLASLSVKAPWQKQKLVQQGKNFTQQQLTNLLSQLAILDFRQKTGQLPYSIEFGLELLIAKL